MVLASCCRSCSSRCSPMCSTSRLQAGAKVALDLASFEVVRAFRKPLLELVETHRPDFLICNEVSSWSGTPGLQFSHAASRQSTCAGNLLSRHCHDANRLKCTNPGQHVHQGSLKCNPVHKQSCVISGTRTRRWRCWAGRGRAARRSKRWNGWRGTPP